MGISNTLEMFFGAHSSDFSNSEVEFRCSLVANVELKTAMNIRDDLKWSLEVRSERSLSVIAIFELLE